MARYLIIVPHDPEDCLRAIEETIGQGPGFEQAYEWGCIVGDHTGYVRVRAGGAEEALRDYVPPFLRGHAQVRRVTSIGGRELREMREEAERGAPGGRDADVR